MSTISKTLKKKRAAKRRILLKRFEPYRNNYYEAMVLTTVDWAPNYPPGDQVRVYAAINPHFGFSCIYSWHVSVHGQDDTSMVYRSRSYDFDHPVEEAWKEACALVDKVKEIGIVDFDNLKEIGFGWD